MYVLIYYIILASNFKPMRGLIVKMAEELLESVVDMELSIQEMATECKEIKWLRDIQDEFVRQTGSSSWEEAEHKFPAFTTTGGIWWIQEMSILSQMRTSEVKYLLIL